MRATNRINTAEQARRSTQPSYRLSKKTSAAGRWWDRVREAFAPPPSEKYDSVVLPASTCTSLADEVIISRRDKVVELAARHAIPAIYQGRMFVDLGGLMSY